MTSSDATAFADAGQSATQVRVVCDGDVAESHADPIVDPLLGPAEADAIADLLVGAIAQTASGAVHEIAIGLTGFFDDAALIRRVADRLAARFAARQVTIADDVLTGFLGALAGEPGVTVTGGTGAVALAISPNGRWAKTDGLGHVLGDHGSGFQLGLAAARAAIRTADGVGSATALADAFRAQVGDPLEIRRYVHSAASPQVAVAGFVPIVAEVARAGDEVALGLWHRTADALAATAASALMKCDHPRGALVSHVGGLFDAEDLLVGPFRAAIARRLPDAKVREPHGDSLAGTEVLHRDPARHHLDGLVQSHTYPRGACP